MTGSPPGEDELKDRDWQRLVVGEVDAILRRGEKPDAEVLAARWPEEADRIRSIVEIRAALYEEGVLEEPEVEPVPELAPDPLLEPPAQDRDDALAAIKREFQDAMNRGDPPDVHGIVDERPELKDDLAELSQYYNFITDALKPDFAGPAPDPVQEVVLSHFRLLMMHARHPLGGLFLGIDQHSNKHAELLVIRGQMSKARSTRLLREALGARDLADPGIVPVIDAGEVHDLRFVAWEYRSELTVERIIRRLRRGAGHRSFSQILAEHADASDSLKELKPPAEEAVVETLGDAGSRLLANPRHVAAVLDMVATAAEALDRAHLRGLILADVRPANVFVDRIGRARLRGFGLVQHARAAWHRLGHEVAYLAPEVLADNEPPLDWRADVYGVALLLYAVLALQDPPDFSTISLRTERLFIDLRGAPEGLLPLLDRALDRDPANRPASCGIVAEELRRMALALTPPPAQPAPPPKRQIPLWVWYVLIALLLFGGGTWVLWSVL